MSQDAWILLLFKIVIIADIAASLLFVADYTRLTRWGAWSRENPIGQTVIIKSLLLGAAFVPSALSLFLKFNRLTSHIAAWTDIALFAAIAGVLLWRIVVFERVHREKGPAPPPDKEALCSLGSLLPCSSSRS